MNISAVMSPCPYTITGNTTIPDAIEEMEAKEIRHLPVIDGGDVVGVLTMSDAQLSLSVCQTTNYCPSVDVVCRRDVYIVSSDTSVSEVAKNMADHKYDCALVAGEGDTFAGIFTTVDACKLLYMHLEDAAS